MAPRRSKPIDAPVRSRPNLVASARGASDDALAQLLGLMFQAHPWHGVPPGTADRLNAYIEITTTDTVKYELDKASGQLSIDRPQRFSSGCPSLYGFVPRTYCGDKVGRFAGERIGKKRLKGDGDPLDICVLTEKMIPHGDFLARVRPIGGLRLIDKEEADDKIVAVLEGDGVFGHLNELAECPPAIVERLEHYFLTYKQPPGSGAPRVLLPGAYGRQEALKVFALSLEDYQDRFGDPERRISALRQMLV